MTSTFLTAAEYEELRSGIARANANDRETIDKNYLEAKLALEEQYHEDIKANQKALRDAYAAAGLNSDGTQPLGRPTG